LHLGALGGLLFFLIQTTEGTGSVRNGSFTDDAWKIVAHYAQLLR